MKQAMKALGLIKDLDWYYKDYSQVSDPRQLSIDIILMKTSSSAAQVVFTIEKDDQLMAKKEILKAIEKLWFSENK
jgi:hypothetical protein